MAKRGVDADSRVAIGLFNSPEHYFASVAAWKLGALVLPLAGAMPERERGKMLEVFRPKLVIADWGSADWDLAPAAGMTSESAACEASPLPDVIPHPGKAIGSGGSTGMPKVIVNPQPWTYDGTRLPPGSPSAISPA